MYSLSPNGSDSFGSSSGARVEEPQAHTANGEVVTALSPVVESKLCNAVQRKPKDQDRLAVLKILRARRQGNDNQAKLDFRPLVERYQERAYAIAFRILRSQSDAEDVVQESFVKAYLSIGDFKGSSSFYTWFYRIVVNMSLDYRRRIARQRTVSAEGLGAVSDTDGGAAGINNGGTLFDRVSSGDAVASSSIIGPGEALDRKEQRQVIQAELDNISEEHRTVVILRDVDGLSYDEIAEVVGVSRGTVMSRLFYARKRLQVALARLWTGKSEE